MPTRFESRRRALQVLYLWDMRRQTVEDAIAAYYGSLYSEEEEAKPESDPFMEQLVAGTVANIPELDELISKHASHWRIDRMPVVDRNLLRLALFEMLRHATPAPVAIDQALELARRFSGDESVAFVNGVLDAIAKGRGLVAGSAANE